MKVFEEKTKLKTLDAGWLGKASVNLASARALPVDAEVRVMRVRSDVVADSGIETTGLAGGSGWNV